MIKKFFTLLCLCTLCIGSAWGADKTVTWTATSGGLGTGIGTGTIKTGDYSWDYTRTLKSGDSYTGWTSNCIQLGKNGGVENVTFSTSNIPGTIKSVSIECSSYNNAHKVAIKVGTTTYKSATATAKWTTVGTITGTGTSSGKIEISVTDGTRAFYVKSISVTYEEGTTPTEAYTVTFKAGTNGTCSTTELTEASAGAGVTLPSCTANSGYVFKGWSTTESGTTPDAGEAGETYNPSSDCTLYAVYTKTYVLTITQPEAGGTLTVKNGDTQLETGAIVEVGTNLTCEVTGIPEGKKFDQFNAKYDGGSRYRKSNPATFDNIPNNISECTISVTYEDIPKYTINYYVNGVNTNPQENVYEGTPLAFPTVNDFGGKVFVGWSETAINGTTDEKPELVNISGLTATANATYYAVFATKEGEGDDKYVKVTSAPADWSGEYLLVYEYNDNNTLKGVAWTGVDATSCGKDVTFTNGEITTIPEGAATLTIATMDGGYSIQVNGGENNGKYINQTSYANGLSFIDDPSANTLSLDGTNTVIAGSGVDTNSGNHVTMRYNSAGDQKRFRYYKSGQQPVQLYLKHGATYSDYCTIVPPRTQDVEITAAKYATLGLPYAVTIPEGVSAYTATVEDTKVTMTKIQTGVIPAECGVILYTETPKTYTFTETTDVDAITGNQLVAVVSGPYTCGDDYGKDYYLGKDNDGKATFKKLNLGGTIAAGKAYLKLNAALDAGAKLDVTFGEPTGIESLTPALSEGKGVYNLNGMKVNEAYKGIVIMNGKKYINK